MSNNGKFKSNVIASSGFDDCSMLRLSARLFFLTMFFSALQKNPQFYFDTLTQMILI